MKPFIPYKNEKLYRPDDTLKIIQYLKERGEVKVTPKTIERLYEEFSEDELSKLRWYFGATDEIHGENRRWSRSVTTIIQLGDYFVALDCEEGLTEYQENEYYDQPYFVEPKEETIVVTRWEKINND